MSKTKKVIDGLERIIKERQNYQIKIETKKEKIETCDNETLEIVRQVGSYEEKIVIPQISKQGISRPSE